MPKTRIPFFSLEKQSQDLKNEVLQAIASVIDNTDFILGKDVLAFEKDFSSYTDCKHVVGVSNGTAALYIALKALGIQANDEVIVPGATFTATAMAVSALGSTPIFADIDKETWTICPLDIKRKITAKTKAIIVVHLYGNPCKMDAIMQLAGERNIAVVEDAAQAHGATFKQQKVGGIGDIACFSFYPSKNLGAMGDAGAISFNNEMYLEEIRGIRDCGKGNNGNHKFLGFNYRISSFQAAVLNVKLPYLNANNVRRKEIASFYKSNIKNPKLSWQKVQDNGESVYHHFVVLADDRAQFTKHLEAHGVGYSFHYKTPVHLQEAFSYLKQVEGSLPHTEALFGHCVSLPMHPELSDADLEIIIQVINAY